MALSGEPVQMLARYRYGLYYLLSWGRLAEAIEQCRLGLETDPLSMPLHLLMAFSMLFSKRYQETIEYARRALEIDANFYFTWHAMGVAQLRAGLAHEGIASLKRVVELAPWDSMNKWVLAAAYHQAGDRERSQELARKLAGSQGRTLGAAFYYAVTGEVDAMFEALDGAYQQRHGALASFRYNPFSEPYRADPRFQALLRRMNLA